MGTKYSGRIAFVKMIMKGCLKAHYYGVFFATKACWDMITLLPGTHQAFKFFKRISK